ncbi:hypothetical protein EYF80_000097 [Liparis tanakae]|uniref:Uncharacterized protein n=1 Tax=Liparis tanakae TaxID=230148 RepID=A0A4Z2JIB1_9TELE|nr:hypothetical protein EYF80_000097 [Liparis tanakae]
MVQYGNTLWKQVQRYPRIKGIESGRDKIQSTAPAGQESLQLREEERRREERLIAAKQSAREKLFEDEARELLQATTTKSRALSIAEQVQNEIEIYKRSMSCFTESEFHHPGDNENNIVKVQLSHTQPEGQGTLPAASLKRGWLAAVVALTAIQVSNVRARGGCGKQRVNVGATRGPMKAPLWPGGERGGRLKQSQDVENSFERRELLGHAPAQMCSNTEFSVAVSTASYLFHRGNLPLKPWPLLMASLSILRIRLYTYGKENRREETAAAEHSQ